MDTRDYALGTSITSSYPWGTYVTARVLCPDGKVRKVARISATADTFFSVPCAVKVKDRTVSGFLVTETVSGSSVETDDDPGVVKFFPYLYGKNADAFGSIERPDFDRVERGFMPRPGSGR